MPMDKKRYPPQWERISLAIRRAAGNRCEKCGIANGVPLPSGRKHKDGSPKKVVLTTAHLGVPFATGDGYRPGDKHDKFDIRRENLSALCQACHLREDLPDHMEHARLTRLRKKAEKLKASGQLELL